MKYDRKNLTVHKKAIDSEKHTSLQRYVNN